MKKAIADMLQSKKALMAIATVLVTLGSKYGLEVSADELLPIISPLMAYIVGQGIADHGKERAKAESN